MRSTHLNVEERHGITKETKTRRTLLLRGLRLEYLSLGWNGIAGTTAVVIGLSTASSALLGFGLDVAIDSLASLLLVWRFWHEVRGHSLSAQLEQQATRSVGVTLLAAGCYLAAQAAHALLTHAASGTSTVGVSLALLSLCLLPPLAYGKIRLAAHLNSSAHGSTPPSRLVAPGDAHRTDPRSVSQPPCSV